MAYPCALSGTSVSGCDGTLSGSLLGEDFGPKGAIELSSGSNGFGAALRPDAVAVKDVGWITGDSGFGS
jgi:hypothetical protein